jgi:N-formylglutamate deformylase
VIDLNRHPESKPLYTDGRIITDLCPVTTFLGQPLYRDGRKEVDNVEVRRRTQLFFRPYHERLREQLKELKAEFGRVLLWDCHSIRHVVPTIQKEKFPDLILGSADGRSAGKGLIEIALRNLAVSDYSVQHNHPFKGGYIIRHFGDPDREQHALQLEMSKINYMDDIEKQYHPGRAKKTAELLLNALSELGNALIFRKD